MSRLPKPGSDSGTWGDILNDYLSQEHNTDGTQKTLPLTKGGTGATDTTTARTNLGTISSSDSRLTDNRTPTDGSVTDAKITSGGLSPSKITGTAAVASDLTSKADDSTVVHKSGTETITGNKDFTGGATINSTNIVVTNDTRLTDTRTPTDGSVTDAKITSGGLSPSSINGGIISLGETSTTAYRGDRGKIAYDHSQNSSLNVKDYGAVGDGTHAAEDTAAFDAVIAIVRAASLLGTPGISNMEAVPSIYIPHGDYNFSSSHTIDFRGLRVYGDGKYSTRIFWDVNAPLFSFNTYDSTPTPIWNDAAQDYAFEDLQIRPTSFLAAGSRQGTAIQDNGAGGGRFKNVLLMGFSYGFNAAYASDFTTFEGSDFLGNDVAIYLGPGSAQVALERLMFLMNREGLVIEGAPGGVGRSCWFIDQVVADVTIEGNTTTRSGIAGNIGGSAYDLNWAFDDPWFETNAGGVNIVPQNILVQGAPTSWIKHLRINRPRLISGGSPSGSNSFLKSNFTSTRGIAGISIKDLVIDGQQIAHVVTTASLLDYCTTYNVTTVDGYTARPIYSAARADLRSYDESTNYFVGSTRTVAGHALSSDVTIVPGDIGAAPASGISESAVTNLTTDLAEKALATDLGQLWLPVDNGFLGWTFPIDAITAGFTPAAGVGYYMRVKVPKTITIASVAYNVATAASAEIANAYIAIYNAAGTRIGLSDAQVTNMKGTGIKVASITVDGGQSLTITGSPTAYVWVHVSIGTQGATAVVFRAGAYGSAYIPNMNLTAASPYRSGSVGTGLTSPPSSFTPSNLAVAILQWFGIY